MGRAGANNGPFTKGASMHPGFCESIIHVGEQPADFCVVTPFKTLAKYAEETAHQLNMRTCIAVSKLDNDVEVALHILNTEKIKLLATRGHALHILRNSTSIPILSIEYSAENFFETLLPFQNSNMRVGHLCFPGQGLKFMRIAQLLGLRGYRLEVEDRNNLEAALKKVREENISLLVGGFGLISKAREEGFHAIPLLSENQEAVYKVFLEAKHIIEMDALNIQRRDFINTVLNINPNIIIVVDKNYTIRYANDKAQGVFGVISEQIIGMDLGRIFPRTDFARIMGERKGASDSFILKDMIKREFLFTIVDIKLKGNFDGYVLSLNNTVDIQKNERQVRQNIYQKGKRRYFMFNDIIGDSAVITQAKLMGQRFADSDGPVLLIGDTGTGKEMFAQAIHAHSQRQEAAFVSVNCAAVPESLLESELFGYEEGAFTGARRGGKTGLVELAHGGTLFLDEIGEMPLRLQARLLRVLQDKVVTRLGSIRFVQVNVRIICATNRNLFAMARQGQFRQDLFYRINTLLLKIPSLEARKEDIGPIVLAYLRRLRGEGHRKFSISDEAIEKLEQHDWPGNVRELLHVVDRAIVLARQPVIQASDILFDADILDEGDPEAFPASRGETASCARLEAVLQKYRYNKTQAAEALGISRTTLWRRMKECGL